MGGLASIRAAEPFVSSQVSVKNIQSNFRSHIISLMINVLFPDKDLMFRIAMEMSSG